MGTPPLSPPAAKATGAPPPPPRPGGTPPPLLLLRYGDVEPQPGPMRVAQSNVTTLRLRWHTLAEWRPDVVLISETRLTAVAQQVMRAQVGA